MKFFIKILLPCLIFSWNTLLAQQYVFDDATITFEFVSKNTKGSIAGFSSQSDLDFSDLESSVLQGSVEVATLDTNNGLRNWSLKSRKYFNEDAYPKIYFKSTTITANNDAWVVKGLVTIKGVEKPLTINFNKTGNKLVGICQLYTSDFGINIKKKREDNLVKIRMEFSLRTK